MLHFTYAWPIWAQIIFGIALGLACLPLVIQWNKFLQRIDKWLKNKEK